MSTILRCIARNIDSEYKQPDLSKLPEAEQAEELGMWLGYYFTPRWLYYRMEMTRLDYKPVLVWYSVNDNETRLTGKQLLRFVSEAGVLELLEQFKNGWRCDRSTNEIPRLYRVAVFSDDGAEHVCHSASFPIAACIAVLRSSGIEVIQ